MGNSCANTDSTSENSSTQTAGTTLGYGSELRSVETLKPLFGRHPNFGKLEEVLLRGIPYVFQRDLDAPTKSFEVETMQKRGNHKFAKEVPTIATALLAKDVTHGFAVPIPIGIIPRAPGAAVQPLGIAMQLTTDAVGKRIRKYRMTQDLSFSSQGVEKEKNISINGRNDINAYAEMIYG